MAQVIVKTADGARHVVDTATKAIRPATQDDLLKMKVRTAYPNTVLDEQGVTFGERFVVKNLVESPEAGKEYLKKQGYEVADLPASKQRFGKWNFAVRKRGAGGPWRVLDPDGMDPSDLLDILGDVGTGFAGGAAATAGFVGGSVPGAMLAGAGGASLARGGLLAAGAALGAPVSTGGAAEALGAEAVGGAAGPIVGKVASKVGEAAIGTVRHLGKVGLSLATSVTGTRAVGSQIPREAIALGRASIKGFERLQDIPVYGQRFLSAVKKAVKTKFPEVVLTDSMLKDAAEKEVKVNLKEIIKPIEDLVRTEGSVVAKEATNVTKTITDVAIEREGRKQVKTQAMKFGSDPGEVRISKKTGLPVPPKKIDFEFEEVLQGLEGKPMSRTTRTAVKKLTKFVTGRGQQPTELAAERTFMNKAVSEQAKEYIEEIGRYLGPDISLSAVPVDLANRLKKLTFVAARRASAFDPQKGWSTTEFGNILESTGRALRGHVVDTMEQAGYKTFRGLSDQLAAKTRGLTAIKKYLGWGVADQRTLADRSTALLKTLYSDTERGLLESVIDMEKNFGWHKGTLAIMPSEFRANPDAAARSIAGRLHIAESFGATGSGGEVAPAARFAASGGPVGLPIVTGLTGGLIGGPGGAVAGAAVGAGAVLAASPRTMVMLMRAGLRAGEILDSAESLVKVLSAARKARIMAAAGVQAATSEGEMAVVRENSAPAGTRGRPARLTGL